MPQIFNLIYFYQQKHLSLLWFEDYPTLHNLQSYDKLYLNSYRLSSKTLTCKTLNLLSKKKKNLMFNLRQSFNLSKPLDDFNHFEFILVSHHPFDLSWLCKAKSTCLHANTRFGSVLLMAGIVLDSKSTLSFCLDSHSWQPYLWGQSIWRNLPRCGMNNTMTRLQWCQRRRRLKWTGRSARWTWRRNTTWVQFCAASLLLFFISL